jgi:protein SCO1
MKAFEMGMAALVASAALSWGEAAAAPKGSPWGASYFPNFELTTQDGKTVKFYDDLVKDKLVVVDFIFTHCTKQCPLMTASLARVQRHLGERVGKDIFFYSISLDPERDTPEALKQYAEAYHAGPGWTFLTGKKEDIKVLRKKFGDLEDVENHSANLIIGNDVTGQWFPTGAVDNPKYLAMVIGDWLDPNWKYRPAGRSYAEVKKGAPPTRGETVYGGKCAACHSAKGDSVGPSLAGVIAKRDRAWLTRWLMHPEKLIAEKDPIATELVARYKGVPMPNLDLDEADVAAILEYMEAQDDAARPKKSDLAAVP